MSRHGKNESAPVKKVHELTPIVIVHPSNGAWTGDNQLGYETPFKPDSNNRQTVLKLDEWGPPEVWTISLAVRDDLQTFHSIQLKAIIEFGAGGSTQTLQMDWSNGAQIALPMNAVNVIAEVVNTDAFVTEGPGMHLGVQLARQRRGGSTPPRLTLATNAFLANLGTLDLTIPAFAQNIVVVPSDVGTVVDVFNGNFDISAWSGSSPGIGVVTAIMRGTEIASGQKLPVVGGARSLRVTNASGHFTSFSVFADLFG